MFHKLKWSFWVGLLLSVIGVMGMFSAWFYFNQTEDVPYVKTYVPAGKIIDNNNIVYRKIRIQDLPKDYLTPSDFEFNTYRAVDGIAVTDPITEEKVTDQQPLIIDSNQVIVSYTFSNTGLLSFINPGDRITIIDDSKILSDVLVLGKADKEANIISLLPALQGSDKTQAEGLLSSTLTSQQTSPPSALLLLLSIEDVQELQKMSDPIVTLHSRPLLTQTGEE